MTGSEGAGQYGSEKLDGRVAVVTGASAGIGEATAVALAAAGASVVITARREDRLTALAARIRAAGGTALPHVADVASLEAVQGLADATLEAFGRVDILVNNAGLMPLAPME
ncbi:MAG TPA: SDR family NAD(P)-dependent oxidoreductase, partial [Longimicrobiaceae bacterium]|nr:SDR family NAD(P)-dependent oxidoreductase [Longimicrobiaceae bacterium]